MLCLFYSWAVSQWVVVPWSLCFPLGGQSGGLYVLSVFNSSAEKMGWKCHFRWWLSLGTSTGVEFRILNPCLALEKNSMLLSLWLHPFPAPWNRGWVPSPCQRATLACPCEMTPHWTSDLPSSHSECCWACFHGPFGHVYASFGKFWFLYIHTSIFMCFLQSSNSYVCICQSQSLKSSHPPPFPLGIHTRVLHLFLFQVGTNVIYIIF